jgi:hypothetical protein
MSSTAASKIRVEIEYCRKGWHEMFITVPDSLRAEVGDQMTTTILLTVAIAKEQVARHGKYGMLSVQIKNINHEEFLLLKEAMTALATGQYYCPGWAHSGGSAVFNYANDLELLKMIAPGAQIVERE